MKAAERLSQVLGANIDESMGAGRSPSGSPSVPAPVHGGPEKYRGAARVKDALAIEISRLAPDPDQPRKDFEPAGIEELAASLKARGQLQPIRVRWDEATSRWVIISGERRYRAALLAGLSTLMCIEARAPLTADEILEDQLVENCLREDLKPVEQARAFRALLDRRRCSYRQLAESLHISHQAIVRALALLGLPEDLQAQVDSGVVPASAAYEVAKVEDDAARREIVDRIAAGQMTRDEAIEVVRRASGGKAGAKGRGGARGKARRPTARVLRTSGGYRITAEHRRGVDLEALLAALREAADQVEAEIGAGGRDAA
jgi:ParB family chromosome partitioning protein